MMQGVLLAVAYVLLVVNTKATIKAVTVFYNERDARHMRMWLLCSALVLGLGFPAVVTLTVAIIGAIGAALYVSMAVNYYRVPSGTLQAKAYVRKGFILGLTSLFPLILHWLVVL